MTPPVVLVHPRYSPHSPLYYYKQVSVPGVLSIDHVSHTMCDAVITELWSDIYALSPCMALSHTIHPSHAHVLKK